LLQISVTDPELCFTHCRMAQALCDFGLTRETEAVLVLHFNQI